MEGLAFLRLLKCDNEVEQAANKQDPAFADSSRFGPWDQLSHSMRHTYLMTRDAHGLIKESRPDAFPGLAPQLNLPNRCLEPSPKQRNSTFNSQLQTATDQSSPRI